MRVPLLGRRVFQGGAYLPMDAGAVEGPVRDLPAPRCLIVPLTQPDGHSTTPAVELNQLVEPGTLIGRSEDHSSTDVHAPLAGRIAALTRVDTAFATDTLAVQIETGDPPAPRLTGEAATTQGGGRLARLLEGHRGLSHTALADLADQAGILDPGRPPTALGALLREATRLKTHHLIINALQPEPMLTASLEVLREHLDSIIAAGLLIRDTLNIKRIWLAVDSGDRAFARRCRQAVLKTPIRLRPLPNKYPQAAAPLLAWTLTGRETPCGHRPLDAGVLVLNATTLADLWSAVQHNSPVLSRTVAVGGPAALRPGYYRIPIGMTYRDVVERVGLKEPLVRLIDGGPFTGTSIESLDAVVTKTTMAILLIDRDSDRIPSPGPCIRCGQCQQDCPVGLDPQKLLDAFERNRPRAATRLHPQACVECGLCSYVCPAELPLAQAAIKLKRLTEPR